MVLNTSCESRPWLYRRTNPPAVVLKHLKAATTANNIMMSARRVDRLCARHMWNQRLSGSVGAGDKVATEVARCSVVPMHGVPSSPSPMRRVHDALTREFAFPWYAGLSVIHSTCMELISGGRNGRWTVGRIRCSKRWDLFFRLVMGVDRVPPLKRRCGRSPFGDMMRSTR